MNGVTKSIIFILFSFCIIGSTCSDPQTDYKPENPTQDVTNANKEITSTQKGMKKSADTIDRAVEDIQSETKEIENTVTEETRPKINDNILTIDDKSTTIKMQTQRIRELSLQLDNARSALDQAMSKFNEMEEDYNQMRQERKEAIKAKEEALADEGEATRTLLRWIIVACVIGCGASVAVMIFVSPVTGGGLLVGCGGTLGLALVLEQYFQWIAFGGLIILAIVVGYILFQLYQHRNALGEVINTTETAKGKMSAKDREEIFGHREKPGTAFSLQSKGTEKLVGQFRQRLKKEWDHVVNDEKSQEMDEHSKRKMKPDPDKGQGKSKG